MATQLLKSVAQVINGVIRTGDLFARYGGEEFVVASVDNDAEGAVALAERMYVTPLNQRSVDLKISLSLADLLDRLFAVPESEHIPSGAHDDPRGR